LVFVDVPCSTNVPEEKNVFIISHDPAYVAIPVIHERCEQKCCSTTTSTSIVEAVPLWVCVVATTMYKKSQGITVRKGAEQVEHVVLVHLPLDSKRVVPGLELVAFSQAKLSDCVAVVENPASNLVTD
jgi:hypothetical protein